MERVTVSGFIARSDLSGVGNFLPTVLSYYDDIQVSQKLCIVINGRVDPRRFRWCLCTVEDFKKMTSNICNNFRTDFMCREVQKLRIEIKWLEHSGQLHQVRLPKENIENNLKYFSLARIQSFLETSTSVKSSFSTDLYSLFTFDQLQKKVSLRFKSGIVMNDVVHLFKYASYEACQPR